MTHRELRARMDSHEIAEWMALSSVEPFGEVRADLRAALIAHVQAASMGAKNMKLSDFMLKFNSEPAKPEPVESSIERIAKLNQQFGGLDLRKPGTEPEEETPTE